MESFAAWLQQARRARDLTQTDLAERVGCSTTLISKLERGDRRPSRQIVLLLAAQLGVPADQHEALVRFARASADAPFPALIPAAPAVAQPAAAFPPLPVAPALIGRQGELAQLHGYLADPATRLITLTGPGGVGKSHLALAFAHAAGLPDGACFVPLAGLPGPDSLAAALAQALGLDLAGRAAPLEVVVGALRERTALLVLDNLEQLLEAPTGADDPLATLIDALLSECPGMRLLATSRERLHLRAEWVLDVAGLAFAPAGSATPLEHSPAELLFLSAMRRQQANAVLGADEQRAIRQICAMLDGLPLALELAASWTATLSCSEIVGELGRSLDILSNTLRDVPPRHRSMRAVFEQSWQLLDATQRSALARLAIFGAGFSREAATFIAQVGLHQLGALVQRSLLRRSAERYELHPVVRHYSREQLAANPAHAQANQRYVDYYLAYAVAAEAGLAGSEQVRWLAEITQELDNLRAALRLSLREPQYHQAGARIAAALRRYWVLRGPYREGLIWAERLLAAGALPAPLRAGLLLVVSTLASALGEAARALNAAEEAVALQRSAGEPIELARALRVLASVEGAHGRPGAAQTHLEQALALWQGSADRHESLIILSALAQLAWDRGDAAEALQHYRVAATAARAGGHRVELAELLVNAGLVALYLGQASGAAECAEAIELFHATGEQLGLAYALEALAAYAGMRGEHRRGAELLGAADALRQRIEAPHEPSHRPVYERLARIARGPLNTREFVAAQAAGRAMPLEQATALAVELVE